MKRTLNTIKGIGILLLLLAANISRGQQDPMFTQYYFNTQTINPAYAGTWESVGFLALGRYQWAGMNGAPTTYTFSVQSPTWKKNVALGLNIVSDKIGREQHTGLFADYSYRLKVGEKTYLRLGLKGGITHYSNPLSSYVQYPDDTPDPSASENIEARYIPNFGIGAFLYSRDYYVGLSVPKIMQTDFNESYTNYSSYSEMRHFFLTGGYVFNLTPDFRFKPTFLTKVTAGSPVEVDLTANFLVKNKVWLGAMYRIGDSYGFIAQWVFDNKLRVGYAIDFTTTKLRTLHNGTHEIMISYEIGIRRKWSTPRMF